MKPDFSVPAPVLEALRRLDAGGFEAWLVGGCVRDLLRGAAPKDYDICTSALPPQTTACFEEGFSVIPTGAAHGTVTAVINGMPLEITTYRVDGSYSDGRHPDRVHFASGLREDLARRDFTVNAMAWRPGAPLQDPFGGREDLARGLIRCVGEPALRFEEDGLRILRALRFASVLDFTLEESTAAAVLSRAGLLGRVSRERVCQEWLRLLPGPGAARVLRGFGPVFSLFLPGLDLSAPALEALSSLPPDFILRTALLLQNAGEDACRAQLRELKLDRRSCEAAAALVRRLSEGPCAPREALAQLGPEQARRFALLLRALGLGDKGYAGEIERILSTGECFSLRTLAVNGNDLMALGIPRGRRVREVLEGLLARVLEEPSLNRKEVLLPMAAGLWHNPFPYSDGEKRYHTWDYELRRRYGGKVCKVPLNGGFTCPNLDGTCGTEGCSYCSGSGSGEFAGDPAEDIVTQFLSVRQRMWQKWPGARTIAYFQARTNTYAPVPRLKELYEPVLALPGVVGLSVATRPDALPPEVLDYLEELSHRTDLMVELGLQSSNDETARRIGRGHDFACFVRAVEALHARGIPVCAHIIDGLPGEGREQMLDTARALAALPLHSVKIHLLHVLRGTRLEEQYARGEFSLLSRAEYVRIVCDQLELLPPEMVLQRLTGDGERSQLIGPLWSLKKLAVQNEIDKELVRRGSWQGKYYRKEDAP